MINFGGEEFSLHWSEHAHKRVAQRLDNQQQLAEQRLLAVFTHAKELLRTEEIKQINGDLTVYDTLHDVFAGLHINRNNATIYVVSFGKASEMYPKCGSLTLQINEQGQTRLLEWEFIKDPIIELPFSFRMNGKDIKLRWTKWASRMMRNDILRCIAEMRVKQIVQILETSYRSLPTGVVINVWNWITDIFISISISEGFEFLDIILYKTCDFSCRQNINHIDITAQGCHLMLTGGD